MELIEAAENALRWLNNIDDSFFEPSRPLAQKKIDRTRFIDCMPNNFSRSTLADAIANAKVHDVLQAARDAYESLSRLPDVDGAFRVTAMAQLRKAIEKVEAL